MYPKIQDIELGFMRKASLPLVHSIVKDPCALITQNVIADVL